jgi:hypothetical protein
VNDKEHSEFFIIRDMMHTFTVMDSSSSSSFNLFFTQGIRPIADLLLVQASGPLVATSNPSQHTWCLYVSSASKYTKSKYFLPLESTLYNSHSSYYFPKQQKHIFSLFGKIC